jgi:DNA invertase Pin-like site-specific DNA recombinase
MRAGGSSPDHYDDGGLSGASLDRPALHDLLADVRTGKITVVVVYKVDRLTRSLADFAKLVELFDQYGVSFVSITQSVNTTSSMGRLTLNVLLSFAQFEREVIGERVRDKIAASKRKGLWVGGPVPLTDTMRTSLHKKSNQSPLCQNGNWKIASRDRRPKPAPKDRNARNCRPETEAHRPNPRRYRRLSPTGKNQPRDRTAWLPIEDSNSELQLRIKPCPHPL